MPASPVTRCVAVASHGKRCQQSPFRGSPYCWHHLQSRKVPAPSRPLRVAPPPAVEAGATLPMVDRMAAAVRLAHGLSVEEISEIIRFIEDRRDGTLVIVRDGMRNEIQTYRRDGSSRKAAEG
jgi:hypothetical protein